MSTIITILTSIDWVGILRDILFLVVGIIAGTGYGFRAGYTACEEDYSRDHQLPPTEYYRRGKEQHR